MTTEKYVAEIEKQIAEHQRTQQLNPPSSQQWQFASEEINRLANLIVDAQKRNPSLNNCKHGVIDATCTICWPQGNLVRKTDRRESEKK